MCTDFTSSLLRDFRALYPEVKIDLVLSNERLDLVAQQIDVALRIGPLPDSSLVARPLARYRSFIYASNRYIARHGEPKEPADLKLHPHWPRAPTSVVSVTSGSCTGAPNSRKSSWTRHRRQ